jgi:hypothetical protein
MLSVILALDLGGVNRTAARMASIPAAATIFYQADGSLVAIPSEPDLI